MKIQHYAIIFIIIILPFSIICKSRINNKIDTLNNETRINNALDVATMDAVDTLIDLNTEFYALYEGQTLDVTPTIAKEGIKTFFESLSVNDNLPFLPENRAGENFYSPYIPAIIVVAYDGFYIYSVEQTSTGIWEYVLSPKIPYAYEQDGYYISFSLGNYMKLYTPDGKLYEGEFKKDFIDDNDVKNEYTEIANVLTTDSELLENLPNLTTDMSLIVYALDYINPGNLIPDFLKIKSSSGKPSMLNDYSENRDISEVSEFHQIRREVIINLIIDTLNEKINQHNRYADVMGITYDFYLPTIDNADWINAVDDVSIMSFVQGIPTGFETYYNSYALGASRIVRKDYIYGTNSGVKLYHKANCSILAGQIDKDGYPIANVVDPDGYSVNQLIDELFLSETDAASNGYYPCMECKP